jgi:hypothetical protein
MRFLGLTLASLALLLTACGGSDDNGDDEGSSPSSSESSQDGASQDGESSSDDESGDGEPDDGESDDEGSSEGSEEEQGSVEDLEEAFTDYTKAFFQGKDDKALEYYTEECQERMQLEEFAAAAASLKENYARDFKLTITNADVQDNTGKVEATYGISDIDETQPEPGYDWVYEDGEWLLEACF